jgi:hypothetical protein
MTMSGPTSKLSLARGDWPGDLVGSNEIRIKEHLDGTIAGCVLSACGRYRYALWRIWDQSKPFWLMALLNPSTATEEQNDPTISRCITRASRAGAGGVVVINTGAIRETDPDEACRAADPVGPHNEAWVRALIPACDMHIAGWGPNAARFGGDRQMLRIFREAKVQLYALKLNRDGSPRHPLYVPYSAQPVLIT